MRVLAVAGLAAVSFTCADRNISGLGSQLAFLPIAPAWIQAPDGGPDIEIERVRGVLRTSGGTDSAVAEAIVEGDSAVLEFLRISVTGDSTNYGLTIQAFDTNDVVVFSANDTVAVRPGENPPATPEMRYTAPDAVASAVEIRVGGASATTTQLDWLGAQPNNFTCLHRVPDATKVTSRQLTAVGKTAAGADVPQTRVGWTSLDEAVATVDDQGVVRARCSNKSTKVIARTFLNHADTITVDVVAPPFTLRMKPEGIVLARGKDSTFSAVVIDENGNESVATNIAWGSSDQSKAIVNSSGKVTALRNGRVQITATAGDRTTVGVLDIVRPQASSVKVVPANDTVTFGQVRQFVARALDAAGNVIGDAIAFQWTSSEPTRASVNATSGVATANSQSVTGPTTLTASIDGKSGSATLQVVTNLPAGTLAGTVRDGATDVVLAGASVGVAGGGSVLTDANGRFTLGGVLQGDDLVISKAGYATIKFFDAPAFPNQTIVVEDIPLPPASGLQGSMTGRVVNAINGQGVSGVTVSLYDSLNAAPSPLRPNVTARTTTMTSSSGSFTFANQPAGAYTLRASGTGYSAGLGIGVVIGGQTKTVSNIILPPTLPNVSGLYVVMTWGVPGTNVPADLDLHVTGPAPTTPSDTLTRFQLHSGNPVRLVGIDTIATIDIADATGPGPEVASVRESATPGLYRFYVKNISNAGVAGSRALSDSAKVRVDVFQGGRVIATFLPPTGKVGTVWEAFRFDGARILPTDANTSFSSPGAGAALPRIGETPVRAPARRRSP